MLNGKSILVTGGTGSFGTRFIETALQDYGLEKVIVYSRDEYKHFVLSERIKDPRIRFFIGDIRDLSRLTLAMREVDIVVHAAALKHVPIAEYNPMECVKTNVGGADNVVQAAISCGVSKVIALSTDKASNPINLYGATKLASDKIFIASNSLSGSIGTRFSVVRYGNVIGSRGSVIPFFKSMIEAGSSELPITDERMTRFWITLDQGVRFVISCLETMRGGELYVPKIPSMRIIDLARAMAPDLPHRIVGIRPGEKLHEVMITEDDARTTVELPDRYVIEPALAWWSWEGYKKTGVPVAENFRYSSDTNKMWLTPDELHAMLASL
jgi:UDP-N-acetylglucosamine 4,6-dehydratase